MLSTLTRMPGPAAEARGAQAAEAILQVGAGIHLRGAVVGSSRITHFRCTSQNAWLPGQRRQ